MFDYSPKHGRQEQSTSISTFPIRQPNSTNPNPNSNSITESQNNQTRSDSDMAEAITDSSQMEIDEDSVLSQSEFLTWREVLSRRSRQLKELAEVYKDHYWELMEEVKHQYREYCWEYGKSPFQEDEDRELNRIGGQENNGGDGELEQGLGFGSANRCGVQGCKMKAMALAEFCHLHILRDPKQALYKGCNYVIKSSQAGPILCGKRILRSAVPSLCSPHFQKAVKHVARALKKAGLSANSTSKLAPKFHVIVAEYVNQIQAKRRAAKKETKACNEVKEAEDKPLEF